MSIYICCWNNRNVSSDIDKIAKNAKSTAVKSSCSIHAVQHSFVPNAKSFPFRTKFHEVFKYFASRMTKKSRIYACVSAQLNHHALLPVSDSAVEWCGCVIPAKCFKTQYWVQVSIGSTGSDTKTWPGFLLRMNNVKYMAWHSCTSSSANTLLSPLTTFWTPTDGRHITLTCNRRNNAI